jgi:hypothetical protein
VTLVLGFTSPISWCSTVRSLLVQIGLFLLCTGAVPDLEHHPHDLVDPLPRAQRHLQPGADGRRHHQRAAGVPAVLRLRRGGGLRHLFTLFMVVPIFNSMARIDKSLLEAARDAGAGRFRVVAEIVLPLSKSGIALGSIFVITLVMGDSFVVRTMSGGQSASVVSALQNEVAALQYPPAAASAVIMVIIVTLMVAGHPAPWSTCARNWREEALPEACTRQTRSPAQDLLRLRGPLPGCREVPLRADDGDLPSLLVSRGPQGGMTFALMTAFRPRGSKSSVRAERRGRHRGSVRALDQAWPPSWR